MEFSNSSISHQCLLKAQPSQSSSSFSYDQFYESLFTLIPSSQISFLPEHSAACETAIAYVLCISYFPSSSFIHQDPQQIICHFDLHTINTILEQYDPLAKSVITKVHNVISIWFSCYPESQDNIDFNLLLLQIIFHYISSLNFRKLVSLNRFIIF